MLAQVGDDDAVFAGLLGLVHGLIGALDDRFLVFILLAQGDAGRKGNQHLFVFMHKEMTRQFPLQAHHGGSRVCGISLRHHDQKFLAAHPGNGVDRAQGRLDDAHQVAQGAIASLVAKGIVEALEVIQVKQCDAQRRIATVGTRRFPAEDVIQAATVEAARQLVFARQFAHFTQLRFQFSDALLGFLGFLLGGQHAVAGRQRFALQRTRLYQNFIEHMADIGDILRMTDTFGKTAHLLLEIVGTGGHAAQAVDKGAHHVLDGDLDVRQAVLELPLLVDHFLQAARGFLQLTRIDRAGNDALHGVDLAADPAVVIEQLAAHTPQLAHFISELRDSPDIPATIAARFPELTPISIDYALMEKARRVLNIEATFDWDDVGSWISIAKYLENHGDENRANEPISQIDSENNIIFNARPGTRIALLGVDDLIVVQTGDALLIANRHQADAIKKLSDLLPQELL